MATRLGTSVSSSSMSSLANVAFIPIKTEKDIHLARPTDVYFTPKEGSDNLFSSAFTFIDFGHKANLFLQNCGVRLEPSVKSEPLIPLTEVYLTCRHRTLPHQRPWIHAPDGWVARQVRCDYMRGQSAKSRYLEQLRLLAANWQTFDNTTRTAMKDSPFVLASRRVPVRKNNEKAYMDGAEEEYEREWVLCKASEVSKQVTRSDCADFRRLSWMTSQCCSTSVSTSSQRPR